MESCGHISEKHRARTWEIYAKSVPQLFVEREHARPDRVAFRYKDLGLYHEAMGDKKLALEHMIKAADDYPVGGYMWDVARVHRDLRRIEAGKDR